MKLVLVCLAALSAGSVFGQSRGASNTTEFGIANLPAQRIGANDLIAVSVYDAPELSRTVRVSADGFIRLPMLRQRLKAEGRMAGELELTLADALQKEHILIEPIVTITMVEYHSRPISVVGA